MGDGKRACGEWLVMTHGIRYQLPHEPFILFDIFKIGYHGAIDNSEGLIYRYERNQQTQFRAKYVRKDIVDGKF